MASEEVRCGLAGLAMCLRAASPNALSHLGGAYAAVAPTDADPAVVVDLAIDETLGKTTDRGPRYPAFERTLESGRIHAWRFDAEGHIDLPRAERDPVRAHFRVAPNPHSMEAAIRIAASIALPRHGHLLLHASAIATGNAALVFAGQSGAGKSTVAAALAGAFPHVCRLADELLIIGPAREGQIFVHVAPFLSKHDAPYGARVPLEAIHFLVQAPKNHRVLLPKAAAIRELCRHVLVYVTEPATADAVLATAAHLVGGVPCFSLHLRKGPSVAGVLGIT